MSSPLLNRVGTVNAVHLSVSVDSGHPSCQASWFTITDTDSYPITVNTATNTDYYLADGTVGFTTQNVDQSACLGATITLNAALATS